MELILEALGNHLEGGVSTCSKFTGANATSLTHWEVGHAINPVASQLDILPASCTTAVILQVGPSLCPFQECRN